MTGKASYRRVLLKVSGEALMGSADYGIDPQTVARVGSEIARAVGLGVEIAVVIGGGNIFRGLSSSAEGMDRAAADHMGMLATVMNALALQDALQRAGVEARTMSAIPMPTICEPFTRNRALRHLDKGRVLVLGGGTGNPFFTTDTTAALRAAELKCGALFKGTQVDGIYAADPRTDPNAKRYERLSYDEVLARNLRVMDGAAIALARDNNIPVIVFSLLGEGGFVSVLGGAGRHSIVAP